MWKLVIRANHGQLHRILIDTFPTSNGVYCQQEFLAQDNPGLPTQGLQLLYQRIDSKSEVNNPARDFKFGAEV